MSRRRQWHHTLVLLPGKSHGQRSLVGCHLWGRTESDTTERLHFHFSLSCTGEGNGNPLQGSCLENPRDGGAWWAAVYGVAQSLTRLKWLSSSSSRNSVHSSSSCFSFSRLLCVQNSQGAQVWVHLKGIPAFLSWTQYVHRLPHPLSSLLLSCSSQLHFLIRTDSSAAVSLGRLWVIMERAAILKYFVKALIWKANFHFYALWSSNVTWLLWVGRNKVQKQSTHTHLEVPSPICLLSNQVGNSGGGSLGTTVLNTKSGAQEAMSKHLPPSEQLQCPYWG